MLASRSENRRRWLVRLEFLPGTLTILEHPRRWWPFTYDAQDGEYLAHVSSLPFIAKTPGYRGISPDAAKLAAAYLAEARRSLVGQPGRLAPLDPYDWTRHFTGEFRAMPYQSAGMERMYRRLRTYTPGTMISDDVGLGKTVQFIGLSQRFFAEGLASKSAPVIVVTSNNVVTQFAAEYRRFANPSPVVRAVYPDPAAVRTTGSARKAKLAILEPGAGVYVMSYETARLPQFSEAVARLARCASLVGLDESSAFANPESATARAVCELVRPPGRPAHLRARVVEFNATPIENAVADLFSQFNALDPLVAGEMESFYNRYVTADDSGRERRYHNVPEVKARTAMLRLGRTKSECGVQVAELLSQVRRVYMGPDQARAYAEAVGVFVGSKETGVVGAEKLAAAVRATFAADLQDPRSPSAKADDLDGLLSGELSGEKVIVFSRFRTVAESLARRIARHGVRMIHGEVSAAQREKNIRDFREDRAVRVLVGTDAMSRGLNLQTAGVVVNLDLPWTAARLRQRVGRAHRIGQTRSAVLVLNYAASIEGRESARTVDDWFLQTVLRKRDISELFIGETDEDDVGEETTDLAGIRAFLSAGYAA